MANEINRPFFLAALICWLLVVLVELGSSFLPVPDITFGQLTQTLAREKEPDQDMPSESERLEMVRTRNDKPPRPGFAITSLISFDALAFMGFFWMGAGLVISRRLVGRLQGIISLIVSFLTIVFGILAFVLILGLLMVMVGLFLAAPFGTLVYLGIWGFFERGSASATLGILLFLKLATAVLLVLAQRDFIKNKGLLFLLGFSLLLNLLTSFLHNFPPGILVSITDALAALIILIVAIIWALLVLIGSIIATIKAIPPEKR
jgi:hypothetical protein